VIKYFSIYKYIIIIFILITGIFYALPNIFGYKPIIHITCLKENIKQNIVYDYLQNNLRKHNIKVEKSIVNKNDLILFFENTDNQLSSKKMIDSILSDDFTITLNLIPNTPNWLNNIYAKPMKLGLDLKGGIYFLIEVDLLSNMRNNIDNYYYKITNFLYKKSINYLNIKFSDKNIYIHFKKLLNLENAYYFLKKNYLDLEISKKSYKNQYYIQCNLKNIYLEKSNDNIIDKTLSIIRNRINELGISETIVRKQGKNKICVKLPGVQDMNKAKEILGKIATLEFLLHDNNYVDTKEFLEKPSFESKLLYDKNGIPWILKKKIILSGKNIIHAKTSYNEYNNPVINVQLGGEISGFKNITKNNIGKRLAIVYKEIKIKNKNKKLSKDDFFTKEYIIGNPVIQEALRDNFQITGLNKNESQNLSILLRSGSLPASLKIV